MITNQMFINTCGFRRLLTGLLLSVVLMPSLSQAALNVFACEPEWAALAKELGGEHLDVYSATTAMQDPHHIQARPGLIAKVRRADVMICSGAELEQGWLPVLLRKSGNANIQPGQPGYFMAADHVARMDVPEKLDRSMGDVHAEGNPHVHTSPQNIIKIAAALQQRLSELDAVNAENYSMSYQQFESRWRQLMLQWKQRAADLDGAAIVTHHNYWVYLNEWLGMHVVATLEPIPGVSPSSSHLAKLKKKLATEQVSMISHVSYASERPSHWLSEQTGIPVIALPASVDFQNGQSLSQWFDEVITLLVSVR